jgi:putative spermidine/putrescine transport system ATP-binding protein
LGTTFVNVTHDQEEALGLSTSVVVLSQGRVMQQGSPGEIYDWPATAFVADFIGNANLLPLTSVSELAGQWTASAGGHAVSFVAKYPIASSGEALLAVRQEVLKLTWDVEPGINSLPCTVHHCERIGPVSRVVVEVPGLGLLRTVLNARLSALPEPGAKAFVSWNADDGIHVQTE